jgi:small subunit ribosomal protein S8
MRRMWQRPPDLRGKDKIPTVKNGFGIAIISTSKGVMTGDKAKKLSIGGELLCEVW